MCRVEPLTGREVVCSRTSSSPAEGAQGEGRAAEENPTYFSCHQANGQQARMVIPFELRPFKYLSFLDAHAAELVKCAVHKQIADAFKLFPNLPFLLQWHAAPFKVMSAIVLQPCAASPFTAWTFF